MTNHNHIILFDGECALCNRFVRFILRNEKSGYYVFAASQSTQGIRLIEQYHLQQLPADTVICIDEGNVLVESSAAFHIARNLRFPVSLLALLRFFPRRLTDYCYRFIANNRHTFVGKGTVCELPPQQYCDRFL